jgi:hypothetical protein
LQHHCLDQKEKLALKILKNFQLGHQKQSNQKENKFNFLPSQVEDSQMQRKSIAFNLKLLLN